MSRDQQANPVEVDTSKLPHLTDQQMTFALEIIDGKTATDAYLKAYPTSQNWPRASVWAHASRTLNHDKVLAWINAWRTQAMVSGVTTLEEHTAQLMRIRELALASGNYGAAAKCEESRGRANGLYVDQIKTVDDKTDVLEALRAIAAQDSTLARSLAGLLNVSESDIMGNDNSSTGDKEPTTH